MVLVKQPVVGSCMRFIIGWFMCLVMGFVSPSHPTDQLSQLSPKSKVALVPGGYKPVPGGYKPVPGGYKHARAAKNLQLFSIFTLSSGWERICS